MLETQGQNLVGCSHTFVGISCSSFRL